MEQYLMLEVCPLDANGNDLVTFVRSTSGIFWENLPRFFRIRSGNGYEPLPTLPNRT